MSKHCQINRKATLSSVVGGAYPKTMAKGEITMVQWEQRHVYCLFCNTGKERVVVNEIARQGFGEAIFPQRMKNVLIDKKWQDIPVPLFPGYVFLYSGETEVLPKQLRIVSDIVRMLAYNDGTTDLIGKDLEFARWIYKTGGIVNAMKAIEIGNRVEIIDSMFKDLQGTVIKMDKRRRAFLVEIDGEGIFKRMWLSYTKVEQATSTKTKE